jgi:hypothetical protein
MLYKLALILVECHLAIFIIQAVMHIRLSKFRNCAFNHWFSDKFSGFRNKSGFEIHFRLLRKFRIVNRLFFILDESNVCYYQDDLF